MIKRVLKRICRRKFFFNSFGLSSCLNFIYTKFQLYLYKQNEINFIYHPFKIKHPISMPSTAITQSLSKPSYHHMTIFNNPPFNFQPLIFSYCSSISISNNNTAILLITLTLHIKPLKYTNIINFI